MKPIKVEFHTHENFVCGRVLDMPEVLRGQGLIIEGVEYVITSRGFPALENGMLFLRGEDKSFDDSWFHFEYYSEHDAETAVKVYRDLIDKWNKEHQVILDKEEKAYLSAVIKPWKNRVKYISKQMWDEEEYIFITYDDKEGMHLPEFAPNSMYKGMKIDELYTLKELGLE